eukprot:scaffold385020_cov28-Attheya_sp.AAC.1
MDKTTARHFHHGFSDLERNRAGPLWRAGLPNLLARSFAFAAKHQWITNIVAARERPPRTRTHRLSRLTFARTGTHVKMDVSGTSQHSTQSSTKDP